MLVLWVMSMLMPMDPTSKSTMARLPIHITRISLFSVFGSGRWTIAVSLLGGQPDLSAENAASGLLTSFISGAGAQEATVICNALTRAAGRLYIALEAPGPSRRSSEKRTAARSPSWARHSTHRHAVCASLKHETRPSRLNSLATLHLIGRLLVQLCTLHTRSLSHSSTRLEIESAIR
jgi:hypothetical protein